MSGLLMLLVNCTPPLPQDSLTITPPLRTPQSDTCLELRTLICSKAGTCSEGVTYRVCVDGLSDALCGLNSVEQMQNCIAQFADIPCDGRIPDVCLELK